MARLVKVRRSLPTPLNYGRRQGTPSFEEFEILAHVQPKTTKDVQKDAAGDRNEGSVQIYSQELLIAQDTKRGIEGDVIVFGGVEYEVHLSEDWREFANYVRSEAKRMQP